MKRVNLITGLVNYWTNNDVVIYKNAVKSCIVLGRIWRVKGRNNSKSLGQLMHGSPFSQNKFSAV
jgi:hypothetical protein